jgi:hypothetical protein
VVATKLTANTISPLISATITPNPPINDQPVPLILGTVRNNKAHNEARQITETPHNINQDDSRENTINTNIEGTTYQTGQRKYLISHFFRNTRNNIAVRKTREITTTNQDIQDQSSRLIDAEPAAQMNANNDQSVTVNNEERETNTHINNNLNNRNQASSIPITEIDNNNHNENEHTDLQLNNTNPSVIVNSLLSHQTQTNSNRTQRNYIQCYIQKQPIANDYWGSSMDDCNPHCFRIYFQNINGLTAGKSMIRWTETVANMKDKQCEIFGLAETNTNWNSYNIKNNINHIIKNKFPNSSTMLSNNRYNPTRQKRFLPGGTLQSCTGH